MTATDLALFAVGGLALLAVTVGFGLVVGALLAVAAGAGTPEADGPEVPPAPRRRDA